MPDAASKLLVEMLTFSMVSAGRDVAGVMRQPHVDARRAVDARGVGVARRAVDVGRQRAARRVGLRVLQRRRRRPGHQVHQRLVVPVLVERQVDDVFGPQVDADVGLVGLEQRGLGGHRHRLREGADLELRVDADDAARRDRDARLDVLLEALQRRAQRVGPGGDVADRVVAVLVGDAFELQARGFVHERDGRARHRRARVVGDLPGDRAVDGLRGDLGREQTEHGPEQRPQQEPCGRPRPASNGNHVRLQRHRGMGEPASRQGAVSPGHRCDDEFTVVGP